MLISLHRSTVAELRRTQLNAAQVPLQTHFTYPYTGMLLARRFLYTATSTDWGAQQIEIIVLLRIEKPGKTSKQGREREKLESHMESRPIIEQGPQK